MNTASRPRDVDPVKRKHDKGVWNAIVALADDMLEEGNAPDYFVSALALTGKVPTGFHSPSLTLKMLT